MSVGKAKIQLHRAAFRANFEAMKTALSGLDLMVVVKANAYGHGAVETARIAEQLGASYLGVVDYDEALELRLAGVNLPILCWIHDPEQDFSNYLEYSITPAVSSLDQLRRVIEAGITEVQLVLDTGLGRNGLHYSVWEEQLPKIAKLLQENNLELSGVMSHLSNTSQAENITQQRLFDLANKLLTELGVEPRLKHLAASAASLEAGFSYDLIRMGISFYGLAPMADPQKEWKVSELVLTPALELVAELQKSADEFELAVGSLSGLPSVTGVKVLVAENWVELAPAEMNTTKLLLTAEQRSELEKFWKARSVSEPVLVKIIAQSEADGPTADKWAELAGTINYEIVTGLDRRLEREYLD